MDHDNRYWFPAKRYGWGWGPPTMWQGWVVTALWFGALFLGLWMIGLRQSPVIHVAHDWDELRAHCSLLLER
jgi:hypothetical protein